MLDRMNPGTTPQEATNSGLSAVVDIDTWETAGDINPSYQRGGNYLQCCEPTFTLAMILGYSHPRVE